MKNMPNMKMIVTTDDLKKMIKNVNVERFDWAGEYLSARIGGFWYHMDVVSKDGRMSMEAVGDFIQQELLT